MRADMSHLPSSVGGQRATAEYGPPGAVRKRCRHLLSRRTPPRQSWTAFDGSRATHEDAGRRAMEPMTPGPESIGERLRRLRLDRGLSQRELASHGVSYAYISRIEAG